MKTELDKKISAFEKQRKDDKEPMFQKDSANGAGRAGYEFLIATLFFAAVGFALDYQFDTTPWITLALFFIGFVTGIYNAWRVMNVSTEKVGLKYKTAPKSKLGYKEIGLKDEEIENEIAALKEQEKERK